MDVYYPRVHEGKLPVVFDFHGGGLVTCDRRFNRWFCSEVAKRGFLVFCIDYPLIPESDVYGILRDAYEGVCRAYELLEDYDGDKNRLFLCGDSAGGFIAAYLAALHRNPLIAKSLDIEVKDFALSGLGVISGMFYSSKIDKQGIFMLRKAFYGSDYRKHPFWPYVNPENPQVLQSLPDTICITSKQDFLQKYTLDFVCAMQKCGKSITLGNYEDNTELTHDFVCLMPKAPEATDAIERMTGFWKAIDAGNTGSARP